MKILQQSELNDIATGCYLCKNARCKKHCPISTNIPKIIKLFQENKIALAGKILFDNNPLSIVCSNVCPHERFCLGNCIKVNKGESVKFYEIEKYISKLYIETLNIDADKTLNKKVAVVGAGPAGLTVAIILARKGYDITLYDKNSDIGGLLKFGIPQYRLDKGIIDKYRSLLQKLNIKIKYNCLVGNDVELDALLKDEYEVVFLGTGVWKPRTLNIKGENFGNVHYAINYLKEPKNYNIGNDVVVIGAGNVAIDAGRVAKENGAKNVTIVYRKDYSDMVATKIEIEEALEEGVKFEVFKAPVEITSKGVIFSDTLVFTNEDGIRSCKNIENSNKLKTCDTVIIAVGQVPLNNIVTSAENLEIERGGYLLVNENGETTKGGVFAGGDVVNGASTVVEVVSNAKLIAYNIDEYIKNSRSE